MVLQNLWRTTFIDISYATDEQWLHVTWKGYQSVDSVKQGCERILELLIQTGAHKVLNDNTRVLGTWAGAATWGATDWFPRLQQAGMRWFAWVSSPSLFSQVSIETTLAHMDATSFGINVFPDVTAATAWLRQCP